MSEEGAMLVLREPAGEGAGPALTSAGAFLLTPILGRSVGRQALCAHVTGSACSIFCLVMGLSPIIALLSGLKGARSAAPSSHQQSHLASSLLARVSIIPNACHPSVTLTLVIVEGVVSAPSLWLAQRLEARGLSDGAHNGFTGRLEFPSDCMPKALFQVQPSS